jgi:sortase (surface protein transpeptidase)
MAAPQDVHDVGWYREGPPPGLPGDAVIDGHLDWYSGPAVFWSLGKLKPGDALQVDYRDGAHVRFQVASLGTYPYNQPPPDLFAGGGPARLSLITCAGSWDGSQYNKRLVVEAGAAA